MLANDASNTFLGLELKSNEHLESIQFWDDIQVRYEDIGLDIIILSLHKNIAFVNSTMLQKLNLTSKQLLSFQNFGSILHQEDQEKIDALLSTAFRQNKSSSASVKLSRGDNTYGRFLLRVGIIGKNNKDDSEKGLVLTFFQDPKHLLTSSEKKLRYSHIKLIEQGSEIGIFDWKISAGRDLSWSDSYFRILGFEPQEFIPTTDFFFDHVHPDDLQLLDSGLTKALEKKEVLDTEIRFRKKNGNFIWLKISGKVFLSKKGNSRMAGFVMATDEKRKALLAATEARIEMEDFVYSVSHDLRAPIRHIESFLKLMYETDLSCLNEDQLEYLKYSREASTKLGKMLDGLLNYNQLRSNTIQQREIDLNILMDRVVRSLTKEQVERITIVVEQLPTIVGVENQFEQLFYSLLENAVIYSATKESPEVKVYFDKKHIKGPSIVVSDNGIGFDSQYVDRIFGMFQQLNASGKFEGHGVGLATARRIARFHKSDIWAESQLNLGAKFGVLLPKVTS